MHTDTHTHTHTHVHTHTTQPALSAVLYMIPSTMPSENGNTTVISRPHILPVNTAFTNSGYDVVTRRLKCLARCISHSHPLSCYICPIILHSTGCLIEYIHITISIFTYS